MANYKLRSLELDRLASGEAMLRDRTESGMTISAIAAKHHVGYETVKARMQLVLDKRITETVDAMRAEELEALWAVINRQHEQLEAADSMIERGINFGLIKMETEGLKIRQSALNALVTQHESIRKLCGLDAPAQTKTTVTVSAEKQTDELAQIIQLNQLKQKELTSSAEVLDAEVVEQTSNSNSDKS